MKDIPGNGLVSRDWFGLDLFQPSPRFLRGGVRLYLLDTVGSTNEFLLGRGEAAPGRLCVWDDWGWKASEHQTLQPVTDPRPMTVAVAHHQTAGRGRQGRNWVDCGGLHLSVVVPSYQATPALGFPVWLGLMAVLCLRDHYAVDARLKWPNDILVAGRKLGGILLKQSGPPEEPVVVAGLGLNLGDPAEIFPPDLQGQATSLWRLTRRQFRPGEVAGHLVCRVDDELNRYYDQGLISWSDDLAALDDLAGRRLSLDAGGRQLMGKAVGIDDGGRLLLDTGGEKPEAFSAGDVHILNS